MYVIYTYVFTYIHNNTYIPELYLLYIIIYVAKIIPYYYCMLVVSTPCLLSLITYIFNTFVVSLYIIVFKFSVFYQTSECCVSHSG